MQRVASIVMLSDMKNTLLSSLLVAMLSASSVAGAALYKGLDANGKVVYSDTPFEDAKKYNPRSISVVDKAGASQDEATAVDKLPSEFKYLEFDIVTPADNQVIGVDADVTVSLNLKPGLNSAKEHGIWLLVDGSPQVENSQSTTIQLGQMNRGNHRLQAQIRDSEGQVIVQSRTSIVFVQKIQNSDY